MHIINPYRYGGGGPWEYATLAAAESSGDPWVNGDQVTITGGAVFTYLTTLAVSGYSGLIHKEPYGTGVTTISAATVAGSEAEGVDPDSWTGFTDTSTGTKTTDYDFDTSGGLARLREITTIGVARIDFNTTLTSSDTEVFRILDKLSATTGAGAGIGAIHQLIANAYVSAGNSDYIRLDSQADADSVNWRINHTDGSTFAGTSKDRRNTQRVWMYVMSNQWAVWFDADSTPEVSGIVPRPLSGFTSTYYELCGQVPNSSASAMLHGATVFGRMTTA